jgi:hypothetical protein
MDTHVIYHMVDHSTDCIIIVWYNTNDGDEAVMLSTVVVPAFS